MSGLKVMLPRRTAGGQLFLGAFALMKVLNITDIAVTKSYERGRSLANTDWGITKRFSANECPAKS